MKVHQRPLHAEDATQENIRPFPALHYAYHVILIIAAVGELPLACYAQELLQMLK
jgi:hypothetical protein